MHKVYLNDTNMSYEDAPKHFLAAMKWAQEYCPTFQGCEVMDVSDVSVNYDQIAEYLFTSEKDANWFLMRWS